MKRGSAGNSAFLMQLLRKRYLVSLALVFLFAAGVAGSVWLYRASSGLLPVEELVFSGNEHLSEAELRLLAGISSGEGMFGLSYDRISKGLLKSPWIKSVSIRKDFPERLMIKIQEVSPFAILELKGRTFFIDDRGRMLEEMKGTQVPFLPVITADPFNRQEDFIEALKLVKVVRDRKIATERNRVEIIADKGAENLSMLVDNVVIKIGQGDYEQKLQRLFDLEEEIKKRAIAIDYVDLRFSSRVVIKPIGKVIN